MFKIGNLNFVGPRREQESTKLKKKKLKKLNITSDDGQIRKRDLKNQRKRDYSHIS